MQASDLPPRLARALAIDVDLQAAPTFYVGPDDGFTPEQWRTMREPVGVVLPVDERGWISATAALDHLPALAEHFRRLRALSETHRRPLDASAALWMRPHVVADGALAAHFPWCDTYASTLGVLDALCRDAEGVLFDDADQGWALTVAREGEHVVLTEYDDPPVDPHGPPPRVVRVSQRALAEAAHGARARIDGLLAALVPLVGADLWGFEVVSRFRRRSDRGA